MSQSDFTMTDKDWEILLSRIKSGKCTPFIGAGIAPDYLPRASVMAQTWATDHDYPLKDTENLMRVSQYLAVEYDSNYAKEQLLSKFFNNLNYPDFSLMNDAHGILASLPLPLYITTNYDDFMYRALADFEDSETGIKKQPRREICMWNRLLEKNLRNHRSAFSEPDFVASPGTPVVYHLHGTSEMAESLVLTEDDYLDFLVSIAQTAEANILPPTVQAAIANTSLLFIGYSLNDINFRVLFRGIINAIGGRLESNSFTLQFPAPEDTAVLRYMEKYFEKMLSIKVVWGDADTFAETLLDRWKAFNA